MKRSFLAPFALAVVLLIPVPALACQPVAARTWTGEIQLATHANAGRTAYLRNECKWPDAQMNGLDAITFDVGSHAGLPATVTWDTDAAVKPDQVNGVFLTATCGSLPNTGWTQSSPRTPTAVTIPATAKWLLVSPYTLAPSKDLKIRVASPGRKCPTRA